MYKVSKLKKEARQNTKVLKELGYIQKVSKVKEKAKVLKLGW